MTAFLITAVIYLLAGLVIAAFARTVVETGRAFQDFALRVDASAAGEKRVAKWRGHMAFWVVIGWPVYSAMVMLPDWPEWSPFRDDQIP